MSKYGSDSRITHTHQQGSGRRHHSRHDKWRRPQIPHRQGCKTIRRAKRATVPSVRIGNGGTRTSPAIRSRVSALPNSTGAAMNWRVPSARTATGAVLEHTCRCQLRIQLCRLHLQWQWNHSRHCHRMIHLGRCLPIRHSGRWLRKPSCAQCRKPSCTLGSSSGCETLSRRGHESRQFECQLRSMCQVRSASSIRRSSSHRAH